MRWLSGGKLLATKADDLSLVTRTTRKESIPAVSCPLTSTCL